MTRILIVDFLDSPARSHAIAALLALAGSAAFAQECDTVGSLRAMRDPMDVGFFCTSVPLEVFTEPLPEYGPARGAEVNPGSGHAPMPRAMEYG